MRGTEARIYPGSRSVSLLRHPSRRAKAHLSGIDSVLRLSQQLDKQLTPFIRPEIVNRAFPAERWHGLYEPLIEPRGTIKRSRVTALSDNLLGSSNQRRSTLRFICRHWQHARELTGLPDESKHSAIEKVCYVVPPAGLEPACVAYRATAFIRV